MQVPMLFNRILQRIERSPVLLGLSEASEMIENMTPGDEWIIDDSIHGSAVGRAIAEKQQSGLLLIHETKAKMQNDDTLLAAGENVNKCNRKKPKLDIEGTEIDFELKNLKSPYNFLFESEELPNLNDYLRSFLHSKPKHFHSSFMPTLSLRFETYGSGMPIKDAPKIISDMMQRQMLIGNDVWEDYFGSILPEFQSTVLGLLNIDQNAGMKVTEGSSTTEFLPRLTGSTVNFGKDHKGWRSRILSTDAEFLAADRIFAGLSPDQVESQA